MEAKDNKLKKMKKSINESESGNILDPSKLDGFISRRDIRDGLERRNEEREMKREGRPHARGPKGWQFLWACGCYISFHYFFHYIFSLSISLSSK